MTAKNVLVRPQKPATQGACPHLPPPLCYATDSKCRLISKLHFASFLFTYTAARAQAKLHSLINELA